MVRIWIQMDTPKCISFHRPRLLVRCSIFSRLFGIHQLSLPNGCRDYAECINPLKQTKVCARNLPLATSAAVGKSFCTLVSGGETPLLTLPHTGFPDPSFLTLAAAGVEAAARCWGWMTFPAWGSCGAAGNAVAFGPFTLATGEGEDAAEWFTDDGRDQPGPVVVESCGVAVSLVVTKRECDADG